MGHSNRELSKFIDILKKYGIKVLIDVRRFPTSKRYPWFSKASLEEKMVDVNIKYVWLGEALGGYRRGGYTEYMETHEYKRGIKKLIGIASREMSVVMCSERFWFRCHRRFISDTLVRLGFEVIHIIDEHKTYKHRIRESNQL